MQEKIDLLTHLLLVEQKLRLHQSPFRCDDAECCMYGNPVTPGMCHCFDSKEQEHRAAVRRALED